MKQPLTLIIACALVNFAFLSLNSSASGEPASPSLTAELEQIESNWVDSGKDHDPTALNKILADDYICVDWDGSVTDKAAYVKQWTSKDLILKSATVSGVIVRVYGKTALVLGQTTVVGHMGKHNIGGTYTFVDVFVKSDGSWRAVAEHDTKLFPK